MHSEYDDILTGIIKVCDEYSINAKVYKTVQKNDWYNTVELIDHPIACRAHFKKDGVYTAMRIDFTCKAGRFEVGFLKTTVSLDSESHELMNDILCLSGIIKRMLTRFGEAELHVLVQEMNVHIREEDDTAFKAINVIRLG